MTRCPLYEEMLFVDDSTIARKSKSSENMQKSYYTYFIFGYLCKVVNEHNVIDNN